MRFVSRVPSPALRPFVSRLWYFEGSELAHRRERRLPGTTMQVVVNLHEDALRWWDGDRLEVAHRVRGAAVSGLHDGPIAIDPADQARVVGAVIVPGAAPSLLGAAAHTLTGAHVEADALWDQPHLRERLLEAAHPEAILARFDAFLSAQLRSPLDPLVSFACGALESGARVRAVAAETGLSAKSLRRRFRDHVGVTPKCYARIARVQRVVSAAATERDVRWAELAVRAGYYDQAHLIGEFRALTGLTPAAYRPRSPAEQNHVVLDA